MTSKTLIALAACLMLATAQWNDFSLLGDVTIKAGDQSVLACNEPCQSRKSDSGELQCICGNDKLGVDGYLRELEDGIYETLDEVLSGHTTEIIDNDDEFLVSTKLVGKRCIIFRMWR